MSIRIKICGITRTEDALAAAMLGVDALGFIFFRKSPRYIEPAAAAEIIRKLPPYISRVGVFVNETPETIAEVVRIAGIDTLQLHGEETADFCRSMSIPVVKSLGMRPDFDFSALTTFPVAGFLLDTWKGGLTGGSGVCGDWNIARAVTNRCDRVILAGGLNPSNVSSALDAVMPYGVDLNSGVEVKPGIKNPRKMRDAVQVIRMWRPGLR